MNDSLEQLITALQQQTEAINRLADSNMALVAVVLDEPEAGLQLDMDAPHGRYMDGSPILAGG